MNTRTHALMNAPHHEAAASAASGSAVQLTIIWSAVAAGFTSLPWAQLSACAAFVYTLHLIAGWWIKRLAKKKSEQADDEKTE